MLGFQMTETMEGYHWLPAISEERYPLVFTAEWGTIDIKSFFNPKDMKFLKCWLKGRITAQGICEDAKTRGYLDLNYPLGTIKYEFNFAAHGRMFLLTGEKVNIKPWNLATSHTTCYTTIINDADELVSRGVVFFKPKRIIPFLRSFRLVSTGE